MMLLDLIKSIFPLPRLFLGFGGGKSEMKEYKPPAYSGPRPYTGEEVGYGAKQMKGLAEQYLPELMSKAKGEGLVGFQPEWYETRKRMGLKDLAEKYREGTDVRNAMSSGQGLRGGIPVSIERQAQEDYGDQNQRFLDELSIADLEARRQDINKAFYQMPEEVTRGAGIQQAAADFGLREYSATKPEPYMEMDEGNDWLSSALGAAATIGGAYFGGGGGGAGSGQFSSGWSGQGANKSIGASGFGDASNMRKAMQYQRMMGTMA